MRNLKKILALVLALVMVVGMMSIATAATPGTAYVDDADITKYDESIQILTGLGIYEGNGEGEFEPNDPITRAEVAALVYRIVHDEKYVGIYADYNKFNDVDAKDWFAGYVNYCANGEYIVGDGYGNFLPDNYVTGYQVLAIILRAIGYDREGEFQGAGWEVRTARKAKELGITVNITEGTLGANATRAMVAELIYRAIAQTSTVSWSLLTSYIPNGETLAHEYFGLRGTAAEAEDYEDMVVRENAAPDAAYGEPMAKWYTGNFTNADYDTEKDTIAIRFNPVKTYTGITNDNAVYTDTGKGIYVVGDSVTVDHNYVDGYEGTVTSVYYKNYNTVAATGNGVVTDLYVVPQVEGGSEVYLITKNTYIDQVVTAYVPGVSAFTLLSSDYQTLSAAYKGTIGKYNMVLFNMFKGTVDVNTLHVAQYAPVTVSATYDNTDFNTSYFKASNTKYNYNANYHVWDAAVTAFGYDFAVADSSDILNGKVDEVAGTTAKYGLGSKANAFFDDYGNVILLGEITTVASQGVGVVIGADTLRISLGKYVAELDMIMTDGSKKTVKAVIGDLADWSYAEDDADEITSDMLDNGAILVSYTIDAATGYYVVNPAAAVELTNSEIVRGDANATEVTVDSTTTYIVETYKNDGAEIKGYTTYKGFKAVTTLTDLNGEYEIQYVMDPNTYATVLFVKGATKAENPETVTVPELVYVMDNVPEKVLTKDEDGNSVTYWNYTVVKNGQVTTLKSTTDPDLIEFAGLYEIEKSAEIRGFYDLVDVDNQQAELNGMYGIAAYYYAVAGDVLYTTSTTYDDDRFELGTKLTLADSVKVYAISGTTLTEIELTDLAVGMNIEFLVDKYGYVSTIYVVSGFTNDLDGEDHIQ